MLDDGAARARSPPAPTRRRLETVWVDEIPLAYMDRPLSRLRAKVAGPAAPAA